MSPRVRLARLIACADELIASGRGVRLRRRFVSKDELAEVLRERGFELLHAADGVWIALPIAEAARRPTDATDDYGGAS